MKISDCYIWGPGEYQHKIQKRNNMLAAFVHFSPKDENPKLNSENWQLKNIKVENVDNFFNYNYENGLWQTGKPLINISFENIFATGVAKSFSINGGTHKGTQMSIINSKFTFRDNLVAIPEAFEGAKFKSSAFFYATNFQIISFKNVIFEKNSESQKINKIIKKFDTGIF